MPISRLARRFWLGSRTSAPLMRTSNLSSGPIAAQAGPVAAARGASDAEPARVSNERRVRADIAFPPPADFSAPQLERAQRLSDGQGRRRHRRAEAFEVCRERRCQKCREEAITRDPEPATL